MTTDLVQLLCVCGIAAYWRTANAYCLLIPFTYTFYYSYGSPLFDTHTSVINHVIIGLSFIATAYYARKLLSVALILYATFHWFIAIDYRLYEYSTLLSASYFLLNNALNFWLILATLEGRYNDSTGYYRSAVFNPFGVVNLWHNQSHT